MKFIGRVKSSKAKKSSTVPLQSREKNSVKGEGVAGSNSRQVAPDDNIPLGAVSYEREKRSGHIHNRFSIGIIGQFHYKAYRDKWIERNMSITRLTYAASSRDEVFYEACPWLESDCEDEFFSVNGDGTPARSLRSTNSSNRTTPPEPRKLPTLGAILKMKAEPSQSPSRTTRLADLLREKQESFAYYDGAACAISRNGSSCGGEEGSYCCIPSFPRTSVSYTGRRKRS
uniref:Uncharacterized protein n=1 Tax=Leersia perrieri TaxID=77586 RepID=A0A0D9XYZ5_9ORYZ